MLVRDLMTQPVFTCRPGDTLDVAAGLMWDYDVGVLPVVDRDERVIGVVTDRDICMAAYTQGVPIHAIPVSNVMAREVIACRSDATVEDAIALMQGARVRRLPVVDAEGRAAGILSINDLVRAAADGKRGCVSAARAVETLAAVGQSRASDDGDRGQARAS